MRFVMPRMACSKGLEVCPAEPAQVAGLFTGGRDHQHRQKAEPTRQAVLRFQRSVSHKQTGNVGPGDWALPLS